MTEELYAKAKEAKSAEELLTLAHENGWEEFTPEDAEALYAQMHTSGELTDEEMENVAGGACSVSVGSKTYKTVKGSTRCFTGQYEFGFTDGDLMQKQSRRSDNQGQRLVWLMSNPSENTCGSCIHLGFKAGTGYCEVEHNS